MANEEKIKQDLINKFSFLSDKFVIARERRIFVDVPYENFRSVLEFAHKSGFSIMCTITGLDVGNDLEFIYHTANIDGTTLNIKTRISKNNPTIKTISDLYNGSVIYERELVDLLGAKVEGLPPGKRYPLPDNWPEGQHPLRKDWNVSMLGDKDLKIGD